MQLLQILSRISQALCRLGGLQLRQLCAPWTTSCQSMRAQSTISQDQRCLCIRLLPRQLPHPCTALSTAQLGEHRAALQTLCPGRRRQLWLRRALLTRLWARMQRVPDMMST